MEDEISNEGVLVELNRRPDVMGKIDEDIDLFNLSIFSDLDIEQIQGIINIV